MSIFITATERKQRVQSIQASFKHMKYEHIIYKFIKFWLCPSVDAYTKPCDCVCVDCKYREVRK